MTHVRTLLVAGAILSLLACSSYHHHGMGGDGKSDAYWQKAQQEVGELVEKTVNDPAKAQQVRAVTEDIVAEIKNSREEGRAYHQQLYTLNADYNATPEAFTKILDEANNHRMRSGARILALRFKMKDLMTGEEWKALSDGLMAYGNRYRQTGATPAGEKSVY